MIRRQLRRRDRLRPVDVEQVTPDLRGRLRVAPIASCTSSFAVETPLSQSGSRRYTANACVEPSSSSATKRRGFAFSSSGMRRRRSVHHASERDGTPGRSRRSASHTGGNASAASSAETKRTWPRRSSGRANALHTRGIDTSPAHDAMP